MLGNVLTAAHHRMQGYINFTTRGAGLGPRPGEDVMMFWRAPAVHLRLEQPQPQPMTRSL